MKFKFVVSKWANFYFFVQNLSEWHLSCSKEYNKIWLKKTGKLSKNEKTALKKFANLHKKYKFGTIDGKSIYLGATFITASTPKEVWEQTIKLVSEQECKELKEIFKILENRFERIWTKEFSKLEKLKKLIVRSIISQDIKGILSDLEKFYNKKFPSKKFINVFFFASPKESSGIGGGAVLGERGITLEVKDLENIDDYILVIIHELVHGFLEKHSRQKIDKITKACLYKSAQEMGGANLVSELIICSLVPGGYLAEKYFKIPIRKPKKMKGYRQFHRTLERFTTFYLFPLTKKYIETDKSLDRNYITTAIKLINKFIKK